MNSLRKAACLFLCIGLPASGFPGGTKTFGGGTRAQAMGDGTFVAVADDASAVYYNPAGLVQIEQVGMFLDVKPLLPRTAYTNGFNNLVSVNDKPSLAIDNYFAKRLNKNMVFGLGINAPFARAANYSNSPAMNNFRLKSRVVDMNIAGVLALKANDSLSFGLGPILTFDYAAMNTFGLKQKAYGFSGSGVLSALLKRNQWKMGLTYHFPTSIRNDGHAKGWVGNTSLLREPFTARYRTAGYLDFALSWMPVQKLLLAAGSGVEFWHNSKTIKFSYENPVYSNIIPLYPQDSWNIYSGLEYRITENQAIQAGYRFLQHAVPPVNVIPSTPEFDINIYSAGYSLYYQKKWRIDLGYEFAKGKTLVIPAPNPYRGTLRGQVNTLLFGINYQV